MGLVGFGIARPAVLIDGRLLHSPDRLYKLAILAGEGMDAHPGVKVHKDVQLIRGFCRSIGIHMT
jgi:hypothetical protein